MRGPQKTQVFRFSAVNASTMICRVYPMFWMLMRKT